MAVAKSFVLVSTLGLALAAPTAASSASALHLIASGAQGTQIDDRHATLGDLQVGSGPLLDRRRETVGTFTFTCVAVGIQSGFLLEQCSATGSLKGGQITLAGMTRTDTHIHRWAITGGTGIYAGARGDARLHELGPRETAVDLRFAAP